GMGARVVGERGGVREIGRTNHASTVLAAMDPSRETIESEVAVVGAGAAGLYTAPTAARAGGRVALISATPLAQSASYWAQGGLAAALAVDDSRERHLDDTLRAGRGTVRRSAAEILTS